MLEETVRIYNDLFEHRISITIKRRLFKDILRSRLAKDGVGAKTVTKYIGDIEPGTYLDVPYNELFPPNHAYTILQGDIGGVREKTVSGYNFYMTSEIKYSEENGEIVVKVTHGSSFDRMRIASKLKETAEGTIKNFWKKICYKEYQNHLKEPLLMNVDKVPRET